MTLPAPRVASARAYLRGGLPAVYGAPADDPGAQPPVMGFLEGLEGVLDPIVALLDNRAAHLDPRLAPADVLDFLAQLVAAPVDSTLPLAARRELVGEAVAANRVRGTRAGLERTLTTAFPQLDPRVRDAGRVTWDRDPGAAPAEVSPPSFEVVLGQAPSALEEDQLARCIADHAPAGATFTVTTRPRSSDR